MNDDRRERFWTTFAAVLTAGVLVFTYQAGLSMLFSNNPPVLGWVFVIFVLVITGAALMRAL